MESDSVLVQFFACANLRFFGWELSCWSFPNAVAYMSFPGKVILRIFGSSVSVACEHKYWFVFLTSSEYNSERKEDWTLRAGIEPARDFPFGFQVQRLNHWVIIAILTLILFWSNPIPSWDKFLLALIFNFFWLRIVVLVVSKRCRLHVLSRKSNIENRWFVSLSCLPTQVLVRVPNFFWIYFWKWDQRLRAGLDRAREVPIGFQVQRLNHWVIIAVLTLILFWWNPIPSSDKFLLVLIFDFLLRVVVVVVSKRCRLHFLSRKSNWHSLVRQSQLFANTSIGSCSQLFLNIFLKNEIEGCEQGSIVRGKFPLDFKSNALTTEVS